MLVWQQQQLIQTFLFLGAAEAAGGFLELIAVNFDHPEGAKHLCQVGRFIAAGIQKNPMVRFLTSNCQESQRWHHGLTRQTGRNSTWWRLRWWPRRCPRSGCRPDPRWGNRRSCLCPDTPLRQKTTTWSPSMESTAPQPHSAEEQTFSFLSGNKKTDFFKQVFKIFKCVTDDL